MHNVSQPVAGLHLIRLPLPFELNHVNVGLVQLDDHGYMLIDTGMDTAESFDALSAGLDSLGIHWSQIRQILVTHMHPDHIGLVARLRSLTGAPLYMHRNEIEHLNTMAEAGRAPWIDAGLSLAGTPHSMIVAIHHSLRHLSGMLRTVEADVVLEGGEELTTALGPARVVWTPGHSVGHVCLYWPDCRLLYAGDHIIEKITPNIGWLPDRDCLADYLASLEKLAPCDIATIVPSHGDPFSGHRAWIARTAAHHEQRCDQLLAALAAGPRTAHHLVPVLWDRHLSPFHYHFALFEVLAHLEYLHRAGKLHAGPAADGAVEWSARGNFQA